MNEQRGKEAFELNEKIKSNEFLRRALFSENIKLLNQIQEKELYKEVLGDENGEWAGFLGQIEVFYSRSRVNDMIRVYKKYSPLIDLKEIIDIPQTRLIEMIPIITSENKDDWFSKARTLTSRDFLIELRKEKGLQVEDECKHKYQEYEICKICGEKHKKWDEE